MAPKLNTKTLLSGVIIAISVGAIILTSYVVPMWYKKPLPPDPTTHPCKRNLDCSQDMSCLNGFCTKINKTPPFPWTMVGVTIGIVALGVFLLSAGTVARANPEDKKELSKSLLTRSLFLLIGLLILAVIGYVIYKAKYTKVCPAKPRDQCPTGLINVCNENTEYTWQCTASGDACGGDQPKCDLGPAECNPSTLKWQCPTKVCPKAPPVGFNCPKEKDGVLYKPRCDGETGYDWICQPGCDPKNPGLSCDSNFHPGCNIDTKYKWDCVPNSSNVCGTTIKPSCDGAMCIDTDQGWTWKCPGQLTRADVIRMNKLSCDDDIADEDSGKKVSICFTDSTHTTPISPTVGHDCTNENSSQSLGLDLDKVLANPAGNITSNNLTFQPFDKTKRLYFQASTDRPISCVLSDNHNYTCKNGGTFVQDKIGISKTGVCNCPAPFTGTKHNCVFSPAGTCSGNGTVDDNGKCTCIETLKGDHCNVPLAKTPAYRVTTAACTDNSIGCQNLPGSIYNGNSPTEGCETCNAGFCDGGCRTCKQVFTTDTDNPNCYDGHNLVNCYTDKNTAISNATSYCSNG
jgi:hypothetical protein